MGCARTFEGLGCVTIAERLNADPFKHPPSTAPSNARTRGAWSKSNVFALLANPKYTGYQVFNRRATSSQRGKVNDPVKWVWSAEPVHEPLIPKWMYDEFAARRQARRGSRDGARNKHPATRHTYANHTNAVYLREDALLDAVAQFYGDRVLGPPNGRQSWASNSPRLRQASDGNRR